MSSNETLDHKTFARIQRYKGQILGVVLWIPAYIFEKSIEPGQEEIAVSFLGNRIFIGKEENPAVHDADGRLKVSLPEDE